jgi:hypothetical protein
VVRAAINNNKTVSTENWDLNLRNKVLNCHICNTYLNGNKALDITEHMSQTPLKFFNVALQKNGDQAD